MLSPRFFKDLHGPEIDEAVPYAAWLGAQPVAPEVIRKYVLPCLNMAGASRVLPGQRVATCCFTVR